MKIRQSFQNALDSLIGFLPNLLGCLVLLLIGFIVAKIASAVVRKVLEKLKVDDHLQKSDANKYVDRKSTRLNSSHANISYAVFCLKKKQDESGGRVVVEIGREHV